MSEDPKLFVRRAGLEKTIVDGSDSKGRVAGAAGEPAEEWSFGKHPDEAEFNLFRYCGNDPTDKVDPLGFLEFVFDSSFPKDAQTRFLDAVKLGSSTSERGRYLANLPGTVKVLPTDVRTPTGAYKKGDDMRLYLNPKDPAFLDSQSRRDFQQFPTELPPPDAKGRAVTVFHEFGHFTGAKDENKRGHNVRDNENPVRRGLHLDDRESYNGVPVKQPY